MLAFSKLTKIRSVLRSIRFANSVVKTDGPDQVAPGNSYNVLHEFLDASSNFAVDELRPRNRPGRSWSLDELRLKSNQDLHKLWLVLSFFQTWLQSMKNLEDIVHERNEALMQLETGDSASPRVRRVTSPLGFTYEKQAEEHLIPHEDAKTKHFEIPLLDKEAYIMQKLWNEKQHIKAEYKKFDEYWRQEMNNSNLKFKRGLRKKFDHSDQLAENVLRQRRVKELEEIDNL